MTASARRCARAAGVARPARARAPAPPSASAQQAAREPGARRRRGGGGRGGGASVCGARPRGATAAAVAAAGSFDGKSGAFGLARRGRNGFCAGSCDLELVKRGVRALRRSRAVSRRAQRTSRVGARRRAPRRSDLEMASKRWRARRQAAVAARAHTLGAPPTAERDARASPANASAALSIASNAFLVGAGGDCPRSTPCSRSVSTASRRREHAANFGGLSGSRRKVAKGADQGRTPNPSGRRHRASSSRRGLHARAAARVQIPLLLLRLLLACSATSRSWRRGARARPRCRGARGGDPPRDARWARARGLQFDLACLARCPDQADSRSRRWGCAAGATRVAPLSCADPCPRRPRIEPERAPGPRRLPGARQDSRARASFPTRAARSAACSIGVVRAAARAVVTPHTPKAAARREPLRGNTPGKQRPSVRLDEEDFKLGRARRANRARRRAKRFAHRPPRPSAPRAPRPFRRPPRRRPLNHGPPASSAPRAPLAQPDLLPKAAAAHLPALSSPAGSRIIQGGPRVERASSLLCAP